MRENWPVTSYPLPDTDFSLDSEAQFTCGVTRASRQAVAGRGAGRSSLSPALTLIHR